MALSSLFNATNALEIVSAGLDSVETRDRFRLAATFKKELENYGQNGGHLIPKPALNDGLVKTLQSVRHSDALEQAYDKARHAVIDRAEEKLRHPSSTAIAIVNWAKMSNGQRMSVCWHYSRMLPDMFNENLPFMIANAYSAKGIVKAPELVTDIVTGKETTMVMNVEAEDSKDMLGYTLRVNKHPASEISNGLSTLTHLFGECVNLTLRELLDPQLQIRENYSAMAGDIDILDTAQKFGVDYKSMPFSLGEAYQEHFTVRLVERQMEKYAEEMKDMIDRNIETIRSVKHKPGFIAHFMR